MGIHKTPDFIIIDDNFINNVICQQIIKKELPGAKIVVFTNPQKAIEYINVGYSTVEANEGILLLDINMPALNGWDILELLSDSSEQVKAQLKIFLLSSSVTPDDKQKANDDPMVSGYIEKPLTQDKLKRIFPGY